MAHNYTEQLDIILDPTGETALSNTTFYSESGANVNAGNVPSLPKQSYSGDIPTVYAVLGNDKIYEGVTQSSKNIIGDGMAILDGQGSQSVNTTFVGLRNIFYRNFVNSSLTINGSFIHKDCIFEGNGTFSVEVKSSPGTTPVFVNCFFKNQNTNIFANFNSGHGRVIRSTFYSSSMSDFVNFYSNTSSNWNDIEDCVFKNMEVRASLSQIKRFYNCFFDNCSFKITPYQGVAVDYADLNSMLLAIPDAVPNYIQGVPNYKGSFDKNEIDIVFLNSALLNGGRYGGNVGNVNIGLLFTDSNVLSSTNVSFVSGNIQLTNPAVSGEIIWEDTMEKTIKNPKVILNGLPDFINNLIRVLSTGNPNTPEKLTVYIETKEVGGAYNLIRSYSFGKEIGESSNSLTSGEDQFHEIGLSELRVFGVRLTMKIQV